MLCATLTLTLCSETEEKEEEKEDSIHQNVDVFQKRPEETRKDAAAVCRTVRSG